MHPDLSPEQLLVLEEAARTADRLDQLDDVIAGRGVLELMHFRSVPERDGDERHVVMTVDAVLAEARQQQTVLKQLLAALRLPDEATGKRPQHRGGARGAYKPSGGVGERAAARTVSSLERARARRAGGDATS
ncbi:hypothetical protein [Pseudokineococcus lusitanus]|uniref:hypothetical protein n=1 Tax=Pseudokineococcus lusitanus TaxID=763993 RepID=UPI000F47618B|nr:hypothetical protein [Pseudokineococcus lusitanus]